MLLTLVVTNRDMVNEAMILNKITLGDAKNRTSGKYYEAKRLL